MSGHRTSAAGARRRILIVGDHPLVCRGLTALINAEHDMLVCAVGRNFQQGLEASAGALPDLVIVDLSFREDDGLAVVRGICAIQDAPPVLVLTMHDASLDARRAFAAGASGCVAKQETTETLLTAIRAVLRRETYGAPGR
jgi:DNA-binding NarL/FixJ family response regulator